jgi:NAD(P)-dependent dehydrogenase (short-subunit alcohol dehydrogenase family)
MSRENSFENKRVVIIGGSSGIGLAVAEESASQGADVVIVSSKAERVQEAIKPIGGDVRGEAVDVSDEKAVESLFTNTGDFDHLVFSAGDSLQLHELADTDLKETRRAFELRYWAALAAVKYGSPHIRKGRLYRPHHWSCQPTPSQGMGSGGKCLRNNRSLNSFPGGRVGAPIRVNAVSPGVVRTKLWQNMNADERKHLYDSVGKSLPVG